MSVPFKVLGPRVLVKPDVNSNAPEVQASGIVLAPSLASAITGEDPTTSVSRGTVVAIGTPAHPLKYEAEALAVKLETIWADDGEAAVNELDAVQMLRDLVRRVPCVALDDDVLFSHDAGQQVTMDGETYVILQETELLAVVEN